MGKEKKIDEVLITDRELARQGIDASYFVTKQQAEKGRREDKVEIVRDERTKDKRNTHA